MQNVPKASLWRHGDISLKNMIKLLKSFDRFRTTPSGRYKHQLQSAGIGAMHLVKINPKVFHLTLHVFILDADLHHLGMSVAWIPAHGFEHLTIEDRCATGTTIFGEQARAVDVDQVG